MGSGTRWIRGSGSGAGDPVPDNAGHMGVRRIRCRTTPWIRYRTTGPGVGFPGDPGMVLRKEVTNEYDDAACKAKAKARRAAAHDDASADAAR